MAAPIGNMNAKKGAKWREAILRALARDSGNIEKGLDNAADKLVRLAMEGDKWALEHIADRLDGKPKQAIIGGDEDDEPVKFRGIIDLVKPGSNQVEVPGESSDSV